MANNSVPNHDFAPAWLKIPTHDSGPAVKNLPTDHDHFIGGHNSRRDDIFLNNCKPGRRPHILPSRHHSIDVDDSKFYFNDGHPRTGYPVAKRDGIYTKNKFHVNNSHFGSVPVLHRRPHSRHDFRSNDLAGFHPSYTSYNSNNSDVSNGYMFHGTPRTRSQSRPQNKDGSKTNNQTNATSQSDDFNHQFPTLGNSNSDQNEEKSQCTVTNGGVWDNAHKYKVHHASTKMQLVQKPVKCDNTDKSTTSTGYASSMLNGSPKQNPHASIVNQANKSTSQNQASSSIYRAFVPKVTSSRKTIKDGKHNSQNKESNVKIISPPSIIQDSSSKEFGCAGSSPPHMEILVKNPKNLCNKKSDFLRKLRNSEDSLDDQSQSDKNDCSHNIQKFGEEHLNGLDSDKLHVNGCNGRDSILSSSLEAEQRLLREMGWKDEGSDDEEVYAPLTEDELREFHNLSKKFAEQRPFQQVTWSPKKIITPFSTTASVVPPIEDDDDESSSSSSSDSE